MTTNLRIKLSDTLQCTLYGGTGDVDGRLGVAGVEYGDTDAFRSAVWAHRDGGHAYTRSGDEAFQATWIVDGEDGEYAPVLRTQYGEILVAGDASADGHDYIRMYGENVFAFEDLTVAHASDFDDNDMAMRITPLA